MSQTNRPVVFLVLFITVVGPAFAADPPQLALVRAKVTSVEVVTKGKVEVAVLEIVHVYSGKPGLRGQTFKDTYREQDLRGRAARFPFQLEEEGLWTVWTDAKGVLSPVRDSSLPFRTRSQKGNPAHADHVKLAEVIETVETGKKGERVEKLTKLTGDAMPDVAAWAVWTLGASDDPAATKFLDGFAAKPDATIPLRAQVAADEVLCRTRQDDWFRVKPRTAMLKAWATGKADKHDAHRVLSRIDLSDQGEQIRNDVACEVVHLAVGNKDWPMEVRRYALTLLGKLGERVVDDSTAFDGLFDVIKNGQGSELRQAAAFSLLKHIRLHQKRRKVVEEYLTSEKDKTVAQALRDAIRKGIEKDDECPAA